MFYVTRKVLFFLANNNKLVILIINKICEIDLNEFGNNSKKVQSNNKSKKFKNVSSKKSDDEILVCEI